ncbi:MAG: glucose-6-phosphate isomerase [Holophagaceae bacterium]|nr:glucose-6-phosphate isomerase [Holophagaceae bacterium]
MAIQAQWQAVTSHPMGGWRNVAEPALPALDPARRLLWCGIGGSLLPSETLVRAFGDEQAFRNWVPLASPEPAPGFSLRPGDQLVLASKSGKTLELWTWIARLRALPGFEALAAPILITQDDANPLATWGRANGCRILPIPVEVGGRFSAFTPIGTLPLAWMGRDAAAFAQGGRDVIAQLDSDQGAWRDRIAATVALLLDAHRRGVTEWVLMPYATRLDSLSAWWVQLVAESLGKVARDGTRKGYTPIRAVGPVDQHSQLQRWMAGPRNLGVIVMTVDGPARPERLDPPAGSPYPGLAGLQGADILQAQAEGTAGALEAAGVPVLCWSMPTLSERELGAFMMAWQAIIGLLGIALDLDPFDQPEVEDGKKRTFKRLGL